MKQLKTKMTAVASAALVLAATLAPAALAHDGWGRGGYRDRGYRDRGYNSRYYRGYANNNWSRDQYVKKAAIGGGAGALIGGLMAPEGYRAGSAVKGGLVGAGAGLGYEYLRRRW